MILEARGARLKQKLCRPICWEVSQKRCSMREAIEATIPVGTQEWGSESKKMRRRKKEVVRPKTLKRANIVLLPTQSPTWALCYRDDGLLASSPTQEKRMTVWACYGSFSIRPLL